MGPYCFQEYIRVHNMMIEKFHPLPDGWREMYDAGTGRHYYWSVHILILSNLLYDAGTGRHYY
jgi:hypothetical protein